MQLRACDAGGEALYIVSFRERIEGRALEIVRAAALDATSDTAGPVIRLVADVEYLPAAAATSVKLDGILAKVDSGDGTETGICH